MHEAERLIARMNKQDALITRLSIETGLRTSDALRIKRHNLARGLNGKRFVNMQEQKTKKIKISEISESLYTDLIFYHGAHHNTFDTGSPIFTDRHNAGYANPRKPIERTTYYKRVQRYGKEIGIRVSPHSFRKLYAQNLWRETHNIFTIQKAMNHKYITTTATYLDIDVNVLIQGELSKR